MIRFYYAGIGARKTPKMILQCMTNLAYELQQVGVFLRSGGADGADTAFEKGAGTKKDIYVPYRGFNGRHNAIINDFERTYEIAKRIRPAVVNYYDSTKKFYARNVSQILGYPNEPYSSFVVCWTPNGEFVGGTGFALEVARAYGIKIFNYGSYDSPEDLRIDVLNYLLELGEKNV